MERRRLGRTGHMSSVVAFGAAALSQVSQREADEAIELAIAHGVNHFDVAPSYGEAELRLGPWMARIRQDIFLGCKTQERGKAQAREELRRSLERLRVDSFDLYQLHAVCDMEDLDRALGPGGAIEAIVEARDDGLLKHIGITGHGMLAPRVHAEALRRFPFDTVMTPFNFVLYDDAGYRADWEALLAITQAQDAGIHVIKAIGKAPWSGRPQTYATWYEPFDEQHEIDSAVAFALGQPVATLCSAGEVRLLPMFLAAAERYQQVGAEELRALEASAGSFRHVFNDMPW
jgi:predicted aldo/keto reductase-like oxidoreductase